MSNHSITSISSILICIIGERHKELLFALGVPENKISLALIQYWHKMDKKKQTRREKSTNPNVKARRRVLHAARKRDNTERTKKF